MPAPTSVKTLSVTSRVIADWINIHSHRSPHQVLGMQTLAEALASAF
ncbi:MAG: hypothetical protein LW805_04520 [Oxalobacteraceae bacterium]|nr:hypothetical protein [Oxalobacteraceae bacterium]